MLRLEEAARRGWDAGMRRVRRRLIRLAKPIATGWFLLVYAGAAFLSVAPVLSAHATESAPVCMCSGDASSVCSCKQSCQAPGHGPVSGCAYMPAGCGCGAHADVGVEPGRVILHLRAPRVALDTTLNPASHSTQPYTTPYSIHLDPPDKIPLSAAVVLA